MPDTTDYSLLNAALAEGRLIKKGRFYFTPGDQGENVAGTKAAALAYLAQAAAETAKAESAPDQSSEDINPNEAALDEAAPDESTATTAAATGQQDAPPQTPPESPPQAEAAAFPGGRYHYSGNVRLDYTAPCGGRGVLMPFTTYTNLPPGSKELQAAASAGRLRKLKR